MSAGYLVLSFLRPINCFLFGNVCHFLTCPSLRLSCLKASCCLGGPRWSCCPPSAQQSKIWTGLSPAVPRLRMGTMLTACSYEKGMALGQNDRTDNGAEGESRERQRGGEQCSRSQVRLERLAERLPQPKGQQP